MPAVALPPTARRLALTAVLLAARLPWAPAGELKLTVVDRDTQAPLAARLHLRHASGRPVRLPGPRAWHDHVVFDGETTLRLPKGEYAFDLEAGSEYTVRSGRFTMAEFAQDTREVDLHRAVNLQREGWWAGDLFSRRAADDLDLLMRAEGLHVVQGVDWGNLPRPRRRQPAPAGAAARAFAESRIYRPGGGADFRATGRLLLWGLPEPLDLPAAAADWPSQLDTLARARRQPDAWCDVAAAASWDLPLWVAAGRVDSIQLAGSYLHRGGIESAWPGCRPPDPSRFPGPQGPARWAETIYFHLLNCGLRIPPTAGSGSGLTPNPLGYNRVYVHLDQPFTYDAWWRALRAGRVLVTNGPLLRPSVAGEYPGHVFSADAGAEVELEVGGILSTREVVSYIELIVNGRPAHSFRLDEWRRAQGQLPPLRFRESGWFLLRAVTEARQTYRFALTGPYYVEIGYQKRVSRESAQFFLDWTRQRLAAIPTGDDPQRSAYVDLARQAERYWEHLVRTANAP
jgi:hypothetical protein